MVNQLPIRPGVFASYGNGWRKMWKYFLELLLVLVVSFLLGLPSIALYAERAGEWLGRTFAIDLILIRMEGPGALLIVSFIYMILLEWPLEYGVKYISLRAARGDRFVVKNMFDVFKNYTNAVLANLLVTLIVAAGFVLLIIPGIIFACKLAFVPYLIVDRRMEAVAAVKESWRMTRGHAFKVFLIGFLAFFVGLLGLIVFGVGVIISIIWIRLAFASLYVAVEASKLPATTAEQPR